MDPGDHHTYHRSDIQYMFLFCVYVLLGLTTRDTALLDNRLHSLLRNIQPTLADRPVTEQPRALFPIPLAPVCTENMVNVATTQGSCPFAPCPHPCRPPFPTCPMPPQPSAEPLPQSTIPRAPGTPPLSGFPPPPPMPPPPPPAYPPPSDTPAGNATTGGGNAIAKAAKSSTPLPPPREVPTPKPRPPPKPAQGTRVCKKEEPESDDDDEGKEEEMETPEDDTWWHRRRHYYPYAYKAGKRNYDDYDDRDSDHYSKKACYSSEGYANYSRYGEHRDTYRYG